MLFMLPLVSPSCPCKGQKPSGAAVLLLKQSLGRCLVEVCASDSASLWFWIWSTSGVSGLRVVCNVVVFPGRDADNRITWIGDH